MLVRTLGVLRVVSNVKKSNVVRYWLSRAPSTRKTKFELKCTSCPRRRRPSYSVLQRLPSEFYFRTTDVTGTIELPEGVEMVMPGDNIKMVVTLIHPIAMDDGLRFAIREGGRTVGAGVVAKVLG